VDGPVAANTLGFEGAQRLSKFFDRGLAWARCPKHPKRIAFRHRAQSVGTTTSGALVEAVGPSSHTPELHIYRGRHWRNKGSHPILALALRFIESFIRSGNEVDRVIGIFRNRCQTEASRH
jgi:hypothetical protein